MSENEMFERYKERVNWAKKAAENNAFSVARSWLRRAEKIKERFEEIFNKTIEEFTIQYLN